MQGLFGTQGMLYASLALIPLRVLMWSAGLSLYTVTSPKTMMRNLLTHPCIVAVYIGFGVMLSPWPLPAVAQGTLNALGSCTTAVSMLVIGSILSEVRLRSLFDRSAFIYSAVRLLFIPVTVLLLLRLLGFDPLIANTVTLLSAMPAASTTAILASKCGGDAPFAAQIVCVSTALSVITLPLVCLLF
ncbi:hypothetical protein SDC9_123047 [bioreactor metagenome]|uniref:Membrane transport protein n=1 Tax=bioreactor metagenome TaxID=1076179 RepID=A0A645CGR8_9ZZZZ